MANQIKFVVDLDEDEEFDVLFESTDFFEAVEFWKEYRDENPKTHLLFNAITDMRARTIWSTRQNLTPRTIWNTEY